MNLKKLSIWIPLFFLLWLVLLRLPDAPPAPHLDDSWETVLSYFTKQRMQFGKEVIFTYGPLGFLYSRYYSGYLIKTRIGAEAVSKALIVAFLLLVVRSLPVILGCLFVLNILLLSPVLSDSLYFFTIFFLLIWVTKKPNQRLFAAAVSVFLAFVSLGKFSLLIQSSVGLFSLAAYFGWRKNWVQAALILGSYVIAVLVFWFMSGQSLSGFIPYLHASMAILTGYAENMFLTESNSLLMVMAGAVLLITAAVFAGLDILRDSKTWLITAVLLVEGLFFSWKQSFVRADLEHLRVFFCFAQLTLVAQWGLTPSSLSTKKLLLALLALGTLISYFAIFPDGLNHYRRFILPDIVNRIETNAAALVHPVNFIDSLEDRLLRVKARFSLPTIKSIVRDETIDVFGSEQAIAVLNDFNYRPRPVFQSYSAYTPFLLNVNQAFYLSESAPRFVLFKLQTIDQRIATADDSMSLDALLYNYSAVAAERGYLLWQHKGEPPSLPVQRLLTENEASFSEKIDLPQNQPLIWAKIEWQTSFMGKLRQLIHKPAQVNIQITTETGAVETFRLSESLARAGFIISPLLHDAADVLELIKGTGENRPRAFQLDGSRRYYSRFRYKLFTAVNTPRLSSRVADSERLRYWMLATPPRQVKGKGYIGADTIDAENPDVLRAQPPSELLFDVPKSTRGLQGQFGIDPEAYKKGHESDVDFFVEMIDSQGRTSVLFRRSLRPLSRPLDQGTQSFFVTLQPEAARKIILRTTTRSQNDDYLNWSYWTDVKFR